MPDSNNSNNVRVRFAPSPTGYLHIGGLRTALFNYLFARHYDGKFILRVEDTDRQRFSEGAVESLLQTLKKVCLNWDEGPYFQSERTEIYKQHAEQLVNSNHAYLCFCTPERLEEVRKLQKSQGKQSQYDRHCRNLTEEEVKTKIESGTPSVVRLKVPLNEEIIFDDIIRGKIKIETNQVDDQVLLKSDGYPTYHLANVIDDHLMEISHIIRGEEWLTSVPKHILLYRAFGWNIPAMSHVPLILNPDKTKLSKRQGDVATEDFLKKGYLPEALINFISLLGWNPGEGDNREIFSMSELVSLFTLNKVHPSGAVFNIEKLNWMNAQYIKAMDNDKLVESAKDYIKDFDISDSAKLVRAINVVKSYIHKLSDIPEYLSPFYAQYPSDKSPELNEEQKKTLESDNSQTVLKTLLEKLTKFETTTGNNFKPLLSEVQKETGIKGKELFHPVRLALTGEEKGPELGLIAYVLGKEESLIRLNKFVK